MRGRRAGRGNPAQGCSLRNPLLLRPWCPPIHPPQLLSPRRDKGVPDTAGQTQASERAALHFRELKELLSMLLFLPVKAEILPKVRIRAKNLGGRKEAFPVTSREDRTEGSKGSFCDLAPSPAGPACSLALFTVAAITAKDDKRFRQFGRWGGGRKVGGRERRGSASGEKKS